MWKVRETYEPTGQWAYVWTTPIKAFAEEKARLLMKERGDFRYIYSIDKVE